MHDAFWIIASFIVLFVYFTVYLKSFFLALIAIVLMFISFPLTALITAGIL